jgi:redox-sensing transcriptional repressor
VFDRDPGVVGQSAAACRCRPYTELREAVRDKNIIVGVLAVPANSAQGVADDLVDAGVRIIFNYSEGLLDVPGDVQVHTSNPAVELLHALYFHLA